MDFASPSMAVPLSPKRPGVNAREVPSEYENIPVLNCKIEDYQKLNDMVARRERRCAIVFPTTAEAIPEPDLPHAAGDFSPAFVDAPRDVRQMNVVRKRIRRYALRHDEVVGTTLVEDAFLRC
ncbi:hypothetical protein CPC08DRAFT_707559 [Agrocybe pediades]|nr:hypothetical protein CPC08DRAFT_707559 [Agrocybe pediades]